MEKEREIDAEIEETGKALSSSWTLTGCSVDKFPLMGGSEESLTTEEGESHCVTVMDGIVLFFWGFLEGDEM